MSFLFCPLVSIQIQGQGLEIGQQSPQLSDNCLHFSLFLFPVSLHISLTFSFSFESACTCSVSLRPST
jgi:hypothetical protein